MVLKKTAAKYFAFSPSGLNPAGIAKDLLSAQIRGQNLANERLFGLSLDDEMKAH